MWRITSSRGAAATHMRKASNLLQALEHCHDPRLHCFTWNSATVTYGVLAKPEQLLHLAQCRQYGLDVAKRPTGGGAMFHMQDCSFTIAIPLKHALYAKDPVTAYQNINRCVLRAIESVSDLRIQLAAASDIALNPRAARFCMVTPTQYDLLLEGKKIGGAAQRHTRYGFIHQGSIAITGVPQHILAACSTLSAEEIALHQKRSIALSDVLRVAEPLTWIIRLHRALQEQLIRSYH